MSVEIIETSQQSIGQNVLLYPMLRQLKVAETINATINSEAQLPLGTVAEILILSRFAQKRVPMYHIDTFCQQNGLDLLYGIDAEKLNDDRVGRCLDAMQPKLSEMKTALILRAIRKFNLTTSQIHTDITNILFSGSYQEIVEGQCGVAHCSESRWDRDDAGASSRLNVTWGHTKKGQDPRCKQVNFSLSVTTDGGVPLWYEALNGNTGDSVCYTPHLDAFQQELGITKPLVVGDSKLISHNNMIAFCRAGAQFIGPATLDTTEKKRLKRLWENGMAFSALSYQSDEKQPIPYWGIETDSTITDKQTKARYSIRQLYIFSRQRRDVIRHTRAKNFQKAKTALHKIVRCLNKYDYKTRRVIFSRIQNQVLAKCCYYRIKVDKATDGRFEITYWIDWDKLVEDEMFDGIYLLRTNTLKEEFDENAILQSYKAQSHVESSFQTIKQPPIEVSPVWLHNPARIESLLFLVFLACLVMALLQREGRKKVWTKSIALRPEGRDHLPLTAAVLLAAFDTVAIVTVTVRVGTQVVTDHKCTRLSPVQRAVLWALGFAHPREYLKNPC